jgi:hypothetical protein
MPWIVDKAALVAEAKREKCVLRRPQRDQLETLKFVLSLAEALRKEV